MNNTVDNKQIDTGEMPLTPQNRFSEKQNMPDVNAPSLEQDMPENEEPKEKPNQRLRLAERLKKRHPEDDFDNADDDLIFTRLNDDYDQDHERLGKYEKDAKTITDMFNKDPRSAEFFLDIAEGKSPVTALIERYGDEIRNVLDDPGAREEMAKAEQTFIEKAAKNKELEQEYNDNMEESVELLNKLQDERGYSDDDIDRAINVIIGIAEDAIMGIFSREALELVLKALNYDNDVATAVDTGETAGRNAKIEEKLRRPVAQSDGTPKLDGANNVPGRRPGGSIFDLAKQAH